jgi:YidC/Oxa1 family membrane protein insertase
VDNRRVLLAIILTFGVLTAWSLLVTPPRPSLPRDLPAASTPAAGEATPPSIPLVEAPDLPPAPAEAGAVADTRARQIHVRSPLYDVTLDSKGAVVSRWALEKYRTVVSRPGETAGPVEFLAEEAVYRPLAILTGDARSEAVLASALFVVDGEDVNLVAGEKATVTFRWSDGKGTSVEKRIEFDGSSYVVGVEVRATVAGSPRVYLGLGPGVAEAPDASVQAGYGGRAVFMADGSVTRIGPNKVPLKKLVEAAGSWPPTDPQWLAAAAAAGQVTEHRAVQWAGLDNSYFAGLFFATRPLGEALVAPVPLSAVSGMPRLTVAVRLGAEASALSLYVGPKDIEVLGRIDPALVRAVEFGFFEGLARLLLGVLNFFNRYVHNYGVAIILLTVVVKLLFLPLSIKQLHAMQKMAKLRPQMKEIESRYEVRGKIEASERMEQNRKKNAEMMALYQREGINPASGCLPLLLQLPVLYGLLAVLGAAIELRHAPFILWIQDLSAKDPLYMTPVLMLISMIVMQAITPSAADPMQRKMMFLMPVLFAWIFKDLASGLGLYWLTQNVLSIVQQAVMNRWTQQRELREKEAKRQGKGKRAKGHPSPLS